MPLLIDGHNLIGQLPDLSLSDPNDEAKLIAQLKAYVARTGRQITVVFDPAPNSDLLDFGHRKYREGKLEVIYAAPRHKADDVIREIVGQAKDRKGLIVVTADGALAHFTRQCGVRVQPPAEFMRGLQQMLNAAADADEKPAAGKAEVEEWAKVFK
ncbi:MAG: NYN domain-containing protein, partial [Anaerolineae bacterium]|nr:NYN domain-containing protein [Anaerolineae bacterium]